MEPEWIRLVLVALTSSGVALIVVEIIKSRTQRGQMDANTAKVLTDATTTLLKPLKDRIDEPVSATTVHKIMSSRSKKNRTYLLAAAVTITLLSLVSWSVLHMYDDEVSIPTVTLQQDYSTSHLQEHIIPKGKRSRITLADGTQVWINANSTLEYSKDFLSTATRDVYLRGEAYFDVVPDKKRPFIVHVQDVEVRVLGTSFNVKGYDGEPSIEATLVHGKIAIAGDSAYDKVNLSANQRAVIIKDRKELLVESNIETETYTSWRKGVLVFDNEPLYEIFPILERTFNVTIHTEEASSLDCRFTAKINNKSLSEVLELFRTSDTISYTIVANDVHIKGRFCEE